MSAIKNSYTVAQLLVEAQTAYDEFVQVNTIDGISVSREADMKRQELWNIAAKLDDELTAIAGWEWRCRVLNAVVLDAFAPKA